MARPRVSTNRSATPSGPRAARPRVVTNSACPSPWATTIGISEPCIPASRTDGLGSTRTSATRASYCSETLRTNRGQCDAPGMMSCRFDEHLAAIADAERERVGPREERGELIARARVEQDGLGPALAGAEHVAVREPAARRQPLERGEIDAAGQHVAHVHVERVEPGARERRRHLVLAVDALLAQHGDARPRARRDERRRHVVVGA